MFEMVLKFGAASHGQLLQTYTQPIVVYILSYGELRGGAWAVLDTPDQPHLHHHARRPRPAGEGCWRRVGSWRSSSVSGTCMC